MTENYNNFIRETMENQPVLNIGIIGHVANGKSTIVEKISNEKTQRHSDEKVNNVTIKLGYANAKIWHCPICPKPSCYQSTESSFFQHLCNRCNKECKLITHISFADCPGHHSYMATMLNGTCVMNYAILVESATNEKIPQIQTMEHFEIAQESHIPVSLVCLNKLDLMLKQKNKVPDIIERIENFIESCSNSKIPIVPISGTMNVNIDVILEYIANMQIPQKNLTKDFKMSIIRSFNINRERTPIKELKGGVIGGSILHGMIELDDELVIYPGYVVKNTGENSEWSYMPLKTKALSIHTGKTNLKYAISGGLIGIQLDIDPSFTTNDGLIGNIIYPQSKTNVKVYEEITLKYKKLTRKLTEYITQFSGKFDIQDTIQINANSNNIMCKIKDINKDNITLILEKPICLENADFVTISKINENDNIDIFGKGIFESGKESNLVF
jgi:translation initiation factor 2 subunit 3